MGKSRKYRSGNGNPKQRSSPNSRGNTQNTSVSVKTQALSNADKAANERSSSDLSRPSAASYDAMSKSLTAAGDPIYTRHAIQNSADTVDRNLLAADTMLNMIAKIAAKPIRKTRFFGWDEGLKMLYCDLLLRLYNSGNYYEAVVFIDFVLYLLEHYEAGQVVSVACSGNLPENCKGFLDKFYERIDLREIHSTLRPILQEDF